MSRQQATSHYTRLARLWPIDRLRPTERHFQRLFEARISHPPTINPQSKKLQINAAYLLLDNAASRAFPLSERMMKPASDLEHYEKLAKEIEEVPDRGFLGRVMKRLGGLVRMR